MRKYFIILINNGPREVRIMKKIGGHKKSLDTVPLDGSLKRPIEFNRWKSEHQKINWSFKTFSGRHGTLMDSVTRF